MSGKKRGGGVNPIHIWLTQALLPDGGPNIVLVQGVREAGAYSLLDIMLKGTS